MTPDSPDPIDVNLTAERLGRTHLDLETAMEPRWKSPRVRAYAEALGFDPDTGENQPAPTGAATPPQPTAESEYSTEEIAALRADFEAFVRRRNVSPEVFAIVCPWASPTPTEGAREWTRTDSEAAAWREIARRSDEAHDYCHRHNLRIGQNIWHAILDDALRLRAAHGGRQEAPPAQTAEDACRYIEANYADEPMMREFVEAIRREAWGPVGRSAVGAETCANCGTTEPSDGDWYRLCGKCRWGAVGAETPAQWQPIETAPHDGTPFIGCNIHGEIYVMMFSVRLGDWADWVHEVDACTPTHWMPLPAAPSASQPTQKEEQ